MTLEELQARIDTVKDLHPERWKDLKVVIVTKDPSVGPRACSQVIAANKGFDWENFRFNIEPQDNLVKTK